MMHIVAIASIPIDIAPNSGTIKVPIMVSSFEFSGIEIEIVFRSCL